MTVLSNLWGIVTAIPFVGGGLVYAVLMLAARDQRLALRWAVNVTNVLLVNAVAASHALIWPDAWPAWWWIITLFAGTAALLAWLQWRVRGIVSLRKIGFSTWRLSFLLLSVAYVVLFTAGVWTYMQDV